MRPVNKVQEGTAVLLEGRIQAAVGKAHRKCSNVVGIGIIHTNSSIKFQFLGRPELQLRPSPYRIQTPDADLRIKDRTAQNRGAANPSAQRAYCVPTIKFAN